MSIDGIGKKPGVTGAETTGPVGATSAGAKPAFEVGKSSAVGAAREVSPAERVRSGEMDMKAYVDLRVNEATKHLEGKLGPSDLEKVKAHLRSQITDDPTIQEMVKAATGVAPPADEG
jgi:hypothetical protein